MSISQINPLVENLTESLAVARKSLEMMNMMLNQTILKQHELEDQLAAERRQNADLLKRLSRSGFEIVKG